MIRTLPLLAVLPVLPLLAAAGGCAPPTRTFGGTVTGTIVDSSAQPAGFVAVFVVDPVRGEKARQSDALTGSNGRFRLEAPAGLWTLVATDFSGNAVFESEVRVQDGGVTDVGTLYLEPCATPGSGSNDDVYAECPDPEAEGMGYGAPAGPYGIDVFVPEYTDATLSQYSGSPDLLQVYSYSAAQSLQVDLQIHESSPYFSVGVHDIPGPTTDFFATVYDSQSSVFYVFRSGTLRVEALEPEDGGIFRARFENAVFEWYDSDAGYTQAAYTLTIGATDPAMTDAIAASSVADPAPAEPPPGTSYAFPVFTPAFTQVEAMEDGSAVLVTYDDSLGAGAYLQLIFEVPPAFTGAGSVAVQNTFDEPASLEMRATALYGDGTGGEYLYVLESANWIVDDALTGPGDTFAARLEDATFLWQQDPASPPSSSFTLTIGTSGTMSGVAAPENDAGAGGRVDWFQLKPGLLVNMGG